jgi:hypothetical protein
LILIFLASICFLASGVFASGTVDINTASLAQLDTLAGIGPVYAQRIIDGRPYSSIDDLDRVKGIGPAILQKIKDQGLAYVAGGSPLAENSEAGKDTTPMETPAPEPIEMVNKPPETITYPSGVLINEIMPNPKGADETDEWIELYNPNNSDVDLSGWQIQDAAGTITAFTIPRDIKITAGGFLVFKRPDTKIMLNNDKDGVNLLTPDKKIVDSVSFTSAPLGQSYNKTSGVPFGSWQWSLTLTPGNKNIIAAAAKTLPKTKNSVKNNGVELGLADISQILNTNQNNNTKSPWFLFFTALTTTLILAAIVLFIKIKFSQKTI